MSANVFVITMNGTEQWSDEDKNELLKRIEETLKSCTHLPHRHPGSIGLYKNAELLDHIHILLNDVKIFKFS